jgi:large subunit ribosomal protein L14
MVQLGTMLKVADKTSVVLAHCIKVLGSSKKKIAKVGEVVLVSVK